jgi:hypothetical protein
MSAGIRLDDAVRGLLTEQGSKKLGKDDLWTLVNAATRLRLTAHTLAGLRPATLVTSAGPAAGVVPACLPLAGADGYAGGPACVGLRTEAADLAGFYDAIAQEMSRPSARPTTVAPPLVMPPAMPRQASTADANAPVEASPGPESPEPESPEPGSPETELPHPHLLWVQEHLHHLSKDAQSVSEPAQHLAEVRRRPWWR